VATEPDFLRESLSVMIIIPLLIIPVPDAQPVPKSMVIVFGNPWAGVTVTVAQAGKFPIGEVTPVGVDPAELLSTEACVKIFSASAFKLSDIALSVLISVVEAISELEDELVLAELSFLQE
jgi:hypothetical protein